MSTTLDKEALIESTRIIFFLVLLPLYSQLSAQECETTMDAYSVKPGNKFTILLEADGRIKANGKSKENKVDFVLEAGEDYSLELKVDADEMITSVLQGIGKQYHKLQQRLDNPKTDTDSQLLTWLSATDSEYVILKRLQTIADVLQSSNPRGRLGEVAKYLNTAALDIDMATFSETLTGIIKVGCREEEPLSFIENGGMFTAIIKFRTCSCLDNNIEVTVNSIELRDEIALRYFNSMRNAVNPFQEVDTSYIATQYRNLQDWQATYDRLKEVEGREPAIWGPRLRGGILALVDSVYIREIYPNKFMSGEKADVLNLSNWIFHTIWIADGAIKLNPLPFTDDKYLPVLEEQTAVVDRNSNYDEYRDQLLLDLKKSGELNNGRLNFRLVDSLLRGADVKFFRKIRPTANDSLISLNNELRKDFLTIRLPLQKVTFHVPAFRAKDTRIINLDGGGDLVVRGSKRIPPAITNRDSLYFMVSNLPGTRKLKATTSSTSIEDRSSALAAVIQFGEVASSVAGVRAVAVTSVTKLINEFAVSKNIEIDTTESESVEHNIDPVAGKFQETLSGSVFDSIGDITGDSISVSGANILIDGLYLDTGSEFDSAFGFDDSARASLKQSVAKMTTTTAEGEKYVSLNSLRNVALQQRQRELRSLLYQQSAIINAALSLFASPSSRILPPEKLNSSRKIKKIPAFRNIFIYQPNDGKAQQHDLLLELVDAKGKRQTGRRLRYKTSPGHRISASIGPTIFTGKEKGTLTEASDTDSGISSETEARRFGVAAGIHVHPWRMVNTDDRFISELKDKEWLSRVSVFLGANLRDPLSLPQAGVSLDLWPGIKVIGGLQFHRRNYYRVLNDKIVEEDYTYEHAGFFTLGIDPLGLASLLNILK